MHTCIAHERLQIFSPIFYVSLVIQQTSRTVALYQDSDPEELHIRMSWNACDSVLQRLRNIL